jgi:hypothetical protein
MDSQQSELQLLALVGGASFVIGSHVATWQRRPNDEKIVDLSFRGKHFEITQEGPGAILHADGQIGTGGRPRMLINGIRRPDGRLFQGRSLKELVRMLDLYFDDFIEIPTRLERMERKLDTLIAGGRVASGASLPRRRAIGGRNRDASVEFSHQEFGPVITSLERIGEYLLGTPSWLARREEIEWSRKALYGQLCRWFGVLGAGCTVIRSNERLGEQVGLGREAVGNGLRELNDLRLIHIEGPAKGKRRVYLHVHPWMKNPEAVPTWVKLPQVEQAACGKLPQQLAASSDKSCGKLRHKEVINNEQEQKHQEPDESITLGNSIPNTSGNASDSVCLEGYQNQNQPARDHPKWPEFDRYCRGQLDKHGTPASPLRKVSGLGLTNKTRNGVTRRHPTRTASWVGSWTKNTTRKRRRTGLLRITQSCWRKIDFAGPEGARTARLSSFLSRRKQTMNDKIKRAAQREATRRAFEINEALRLRCEEGEKLLDELSRVMTRCALGEIGPALNAAADFLDFFVGKGFTFDSEEDNAEFFRLFDALGAALAGTGFVNFKPLASPDKIIELPYQPDPAA